MDENIMITRSFSIYEDLYFSGARIINLLNESCKYRIKIFLNSENINSIDFYASHPFLVFNKDSREYQELSYYGFPEKSIEYNNSKHVFDNQREKTKHVLGMLLSKDLVNIRNEEKQIIYILTDLGKQIASKFQTNYIKSYRKSVEFLLLHIKLMSNNKFREFNNQMYNVMV